MTWPSMASPYVTTNSGLVHLAGCTALRAGTTRWGWHPVNDEQGLNTACEVCLPGGLPEGEES